MTFRKMLVAVQVALSLLLLVGAGLFIRSLSNLRDLDPGFRTRNLLSFGIDPTLNGYPPARTRAVYRNLLDRLRVTPGVKLAALAIMPVLQDSEWDMWVTVEGYTPKPGDIPDPHFNFVSPGYFKALDIRLLTGRDFDDRDDKTSPKVCIVNEKFARHYFHRTNVLGRHIGVGGDPGTKTDITIVGVSRNTKYEGMRDDIPEEVFEPYRQLDFESEMFVYAETASKPETMFQTMRDLVRSIDPNLPITRLRSLEEQKDLSLMTERLVANLSAAFAFVASLLAGIGLYGVMTYTVAWRTREIGVRMALGASIQNVLWLVVREILVLVGFGIGISLPVTWILSTLLRSQLYGLTPNDPASIVAAALGLALVATIAGYVPSRRAARIDPMRALRWE